MAIGIYYGRHDRKVDIMGWILCKRCSIWEGKFDGVVWRE